MAGNFIRAERKNAFFAVGVRKVQKAFLFSHTFRYCTFHQQHLRGVVGARKMVATTQSYGLFFETSTTAQSVPLQWNGGFLFHNV